MSKQILLYGTLRDQEEALVEIEGLVDVVYVSMQDHDSEWVPTYSSFRQIPGWGRERFWPYGFLVLARGVKAHITDRWVGGIRKFECSPSKNPCSILFIPMHEALEGGNRVLYGGKVGGILADSESKNIYNSFRKVFVRRFKTMGRSVMIGPEADQLKLERSISPI